MTASTASIRDEVLVAADLCEELGENSYSLIIRDFANAYSGKRTYRTIRTWDWNFGSAKIKDEASLADDSTWVDHFISSVAALRNLTPPAKVLKADLNQPVLSQSSQTEQADENHLKGSKEPGHRPQAIDQPALYSLEELKLFLKQHTVDGMLVERGFKKAVHAILELRIRLKEILETSLLNLLAKGHVSIDQVIDAFAVADQANWPVTNSLMKLGYATEEQITWAQARFDKTEFVSPRYFDDMDDDEMERVVALIPAAVCQENVVMPLGEENGLLKVGCTCPSNLDLESKLHFILNRKICLASVTRTAIHVWINRFYGEVIGETYMGILDEFASSSISYDESAYIPEQHLVPVNQNEPLPEPRQLVEPETERLLSQFRSIFKPVKD